MIDLTQTVAALEAFVLGITRHVTEQKAAQAEIDVIIGRDRLPTFADRERLPYCEALYLETLRYYTIGPLGEQTLDYDQLSCLSMKYM